MSGWTKLFSGIVTSSLWCQDDSTVRVWIAMLATADSGGLVEGSVPGFANLARVSIEQMRAAVAKLSSPDPDSRTPDHEGRRIEPVEGGWLILNYLKYRERGQEKEGSRAPYYRLYRARKRAEAQADTRNAATSPATSCVAHNTEERREKREAEAEAEKRKRTPARSARGRLPPPIAAPVDATATENGNGARKATTRPGWVALAGDALKQRRGGTGDYGRIGKELTGLVREHGEEEVLRRWARYLDGPSYFGPHAFAVDFGRWAVDAAPAAVGGRRPSPGETAMAEAEKFLRGGRA